MLRSLSQRSSRPKKRQQIEEDEKSGNTEVVAIQTDEDERSDEASHQEVMEKSPSCHDDVQSASKVVAKDLQSPKKEQRSVSFGALHVREFPVVMGDNPSVQFGGPPLRLEYNDGEVQYTCIRIDDYEQRRAGRRTATELRVPATLRRKWVGRDGSLERQVFRSQCQRRRTAATTDNDELHYALERARRGLVKQLSFNNKPKCPADHWCRQYKEQRKTVLVAKETTKSRHRLFSCWPANRRKQGIPGRKKHRIQDISTFFV